MAILTGQAHQTIHEMLNGAAYINDGTPRTIVFRASDGSLQMRTLPNDAAEDSWVAANSFNEIISVR